MTRSVAATSSRRGVFGYGVAFASVAALPLLAFLAIPARQERALS